jgi:hypothetical protein
MPHTALSAHAQISRPPKFVQKLPHTARKILASPSSQMLVKMPRSYISDPTPALFFQNAGEHVLFVNVTSA